LSAGLSPEHLADQLERQRADRQLVWIRVGQTEVQLGARTGAAMAGEVDQQGVLGAGRVLAQGTVNGTWV
jgi:hypothetical protein